MGQEAVVLWGRTIDGRPALGMAPIEREGKAARLGEWRFEDGPDDEVQDNLVQFFFTGYLLGLKGDGKKDAGT